jgi:dTDP-4-amino-4,6-dideoxygalactose transaminase
MIPFYKHNLNKNKNYLKSTLNSSYLTSGPVCEKIEKLLSKKFNKKYALLTNSWTNALISILLSMKLKPDDEVIIPGCTFVACANVIEMVGAKVVFADIDSKTKLLSIEDCLKKITKKTKVIMPVHLYGNLFNTKLLKKKIRKKIFIIEDSAHAFCGEYNNKILGHYSDFAVFSFYATKSITCGEGGAIITNHKKYANIIKSISNNGMTKPAFKRFQNNKYIPWDVYNYGFKANLSDINASILEEQVINYSKIAKIKKNIFKKYKKYLEKTNQLSFPRENQNKDRDYYLFPIGVKSNLRDKLISFLLKNKIFVTVNFKSITELTYYKKKYKKFDCKESNKWGKETLSLPFHSKITEKEIKIVSNKINEFFSKSY